MSLPSKLTSYLTAGRPVLAAVDVDGATARELARTGGAAVRVDPGAPEQFADAVLALQGDAAQCRRMSEHGRAFALRELTAGRSLQALERTLVKALADPAR
jgi:glycosyltransferase involved in cell wall biosynthesis